MKFIQIFLVSTQLLVFSISCCTAQQIESFGFFIGLNNNEVAEQIEQLSAYDLLILDSSINIELVDELKNKGVIVLGYLTLGTIERYRSWYPLLSKFRLDYWSDWGEWFADVSSPSFQNAITKKIIPRILRKNFDGIFLDNVDMIQSYPGQKPAMLRLVKLISRKIKNQNLYLAAQNGGQDILKFTKYLDFWNQEGVNYFYSFNKNNYYSTTIREKNRILDLSEKIRSTGVQILYTSYLKDPSLAETEEIRSFACENSALAFVSSIRLKAFTKILKCY